MNRSFSKIKHIQESNIRLEKRMLSEQTPFGFKKPVDDYKDKVELSQNNSTNIDVEMENRNKEITKSQLKDIIQNFSQINCDGISHYNQHELYGNGKRQRPERDIIYCLYYKGKSRADIMKKYKSL